MSVVFNKSRGASIYSQKFNYQVGQPGVLSSFLNKTIKTEIAMENFSNYVDDLLANESDDILFKKKIIGYVNEKIDKTVDEEYKTSFTTNLFEITKITSDGTFHDKTSMIDLRERNNMALLFTYINTTVGTSNGLSGEEFYNLVGALRNREVDENGSISYSARSSDEIKAMIGDATLDKMVAGITQSNPDQKITKDELLEYLTEISENLNKKEEGIKINLKSFYSMVDDIHARIARANPISIDNAVRVSEDIIKKTMERLNKEVPNLAKELTFEDTQVLFLNRSVITDPHLKKLKRFSPKVNEIISEAVKELNITGAIKAPMNFNGTIMSLARANTMVINNALFREDSLRQTVKNPELYNNELFLNDVLTDFKKNSCFLYKTEDLCKNVIDNIELSKNYDTLERRSRLATGKLEEASIIARDKMMTRANENFITQKEERIKNMNQIVSQLDKESLPLVLTKSGERAFKQTNIFKRLFIASIDKMMADYGENSPQKRQAEAEKIYKKLSRTGFLGLDRKLAMQDISKAASAFASAELVRQVNYSMFVPLKNSNFVDESIKFDSIFNKNMVEAARKMGFIQNIIPINLLGDNISQSEFQDFKYQRMLKPTSYFRDVPKFEPTTEQENIANILFNTRISNGKRPLFQDNFDNDKKLTLLKVISPYILKLSAMMSQKSGSVHSNEAEVLRQALKVFPNVIEKSPIASDFEVSQSAKEALKRGFTSQNFGFNAAIKALGLESPESNHVVLIGAIVNELAKDASFLKHYYETEIKENERFYDEKKKSALKALVSNKIRIAEIKNPHYDEVFAARSVLNKKGLDGKTLAESDVLTQEGKDKINHINTLVNKQRFFGKNKKLTGAALADNKADLVIALKRVTEQRSITSDPSSVGDVTHKFLKNKERAEALAKIPTPENTAIRQSTQSVSTQNVESNINFDL